MTREQRDLAYRGSRKPNMAARIYIRPIGRVPHQVTERADPPELLLRVAGHAGPAFSACEVIARYPDDRIERRVVNGAALQVSSDPEQQLIQTALRRIEDPRTTVAGLAFSRPLIMGIVNVTPDSFSDGGAFLSSREAIAHGLRLADEGADILDVGGESTRPGAPPVDLDEELRRVMPVIDALAAKTRARLSVDTRKAEVMRRAAAAGVHLLNDVSALTHDPDSLQAAAEVGLPVVLMHAQGTPETMQLEPKYRDALLDVYDWLENRIAACVEAGLRRDRIIVDPGIGFGKTVAHNLEILAGLSLYHGLGVPVMLGASRKRFIGTLTGADAPTARMPGSIAAALAGVMQGVQILRVHDVAATRQAIQVWEASFAGRS